MGHYMALSLPGIIVCNLIWLRGAKTLKRRFYWTCSSIKLVVCSWFDYWLRLNDVWQDRTRATQKCDKVSACSQLAPSPLTFAVSHSRSFPGWVLRGRGRSGHSLCVPLPSAEGISREGSHCEVCLELSVFLLHCSKNFSPLPWMWVQWQPDFGAEMVEASLARAD